jgi:glycosyltransferase involved in cell wall biosynthesis
MRILLLADLDSSHTIKWATALARRGHQIFLFGIHSFTTDSYESYDQIQVLNAGQFSCDGEEGALKKGVYLKTLPTLMRTIKTFTPDLIHAHYASSYGFLATMTGFQPFLLSVWGSDIDSFPKKSFLHHYYLCWILKRANSILATSQYLATQVKKRVGISPIVIPFGIDPVFYKPYLQAHMNSFTFGVAKNLAPYTGIDTIIKAFGFVVKKNPGMSVRLVIAGNGSEKLKLKELVQSLNLNDQVEFAGTIQYEKMPHFYSRLSAYINVPHRESFGVAVLEAMSSALPVIVSNIGGLPEIVHDGETGFLVPPRNPKLLATKMEQLLLNHDLCRQLGQNGRNFVKKRYNWETCVDRLEQVYSRTLNPNKGYESITDSKR